jgi:hypothetical protein
MGLCNLRIATEETRPTGSVSLPSRWDETQLVNHPIKSEVAILSPPNPLKSLSVDVGAGGHLGKIVGRRLR